MTYIYDAHRKAFAKTAAYVIVHEGERVATIAFKFPSDGAGRLWAYVHWIGLEMVRGYAGGFGYDKCSAACANAAGNLLAVYQAPQEVSTRVRALDAGFEAFHRAIAKDGGHAWDSALREAGFDVWQAV